MPPLWRPIVWASPRVGYALANASHVLRTRNFGFTWENTTIDSGSGIVDIFPQESTEGRSVIFLAGYGKQSYETTDDGENIVPATHLPNATWIIFHPIHPNLALAHNNPERKGGPLSYTLNFNSTTPTWTVLLTTVYEVTWCSWERARACLIADLSKSPKTLLVAELYENPVNISSPFTKPVDYVLQTMRYFVAISEGLAYVSNDDFRTWNLVQLPGGLSLPSLEPSQILDDFSPALWIASNQFPAQRGVPREGNVYLSDREGFKFNLVLENVNSLNNVWDFTPVYPMEGTYIANVLLEFGDGRYVQTYDNKSLVLLKSRITYDFGNNWAYLQAPREDSQGNPVFCENLCSLNLFGWTGFEGITGERERVTPIYTNPFAVGIVVGTGNIGDYLRLEPEAVNTYVSRSGGRYWREAARGPHHYAYGRESGILVLIPRNVTDTLLYSLDEGETFQNYTFLPIPLEVRGVTTVDYWGNIFMIETFQNGDTIIVSLNFTAILDRECTGEDYYYWTPDFPINRTWTCVNGHTIVYSRRLPNVTCRAGNDSFIKNWTNCQCYRSDYECDFNYQQLVYGICTGSPPDPSTLCAPGQKTYNKTQGYRKTPGNTCDKPLPQYEPIETPCPDIIPPTTTGTVSTVTTGNTVGTTVGTTGQESITTGTTFRPSSTTTTGSAQVPGERHGVSPGGAAAGIIIVAIGVGIIAFVAGIIATFRSRRIRGLVPRDWRAGEAQALL